MFWSRSLIVTTIVALTILSQATAAGADDPLVVVVDESCELEDISVAYLQKLYLGKITIHSDGCEVLLLAYQSSSERFYESVLDMSVLRLRKHWMKLVFAGEFATPPEEFRTTEHLEKRLCDESGAIGFVPLAEVTGCMKTLTIDGKQPGDSGYALQ
jgi:hypothetical protein